MQKQQNMTAATSGGVSNRGDGDETQTEIVENIRAELHLKRELPTFSVIVKDDIVL